MNSRGSESAGPVAGPQRQSAVQASLLDYTDRLHRAKTSEQVLEASLDVIQAALRCDRASILQFDDEGVMRFVAWRELSEAYRAAADGHTPWTRGERVAAPIVVADAEQADFDAELSERLKAEGIRALAFIPLMSSEGVSGKFMMYFGEPHDFTADEIELAITVARHLEFALERVVAEQRLRESEARYRAMARDSQLLTAVVQSSQDAIVSKNLNGIIQTWNGGAERLFGYTAEEMVGSPVTRLIPDDRMSEEPRIIERISRGERVEHFDTIRRRKDGSLVDVSLSISPVRDGSGKIIGASKIARNISGRKRMEERLRRSEEEFRSMAENISQLAWMTDREGWIYWYNKRWFDFTGTTLEEMQGWGWQKVHHPDHVDRVTGLFKRHIESGEPWEDTFPLRGADGEYGWFLSRAQPIRDDSGKIIRWFGTNTDITEQKRAEEQRILLINELNHRVKNTLATVQSLASQSFRKAEDPSQARQAFEARLHALARAHDILTAQNWEGATLSTTVERAMEPFSEQDRMTWGGPHVWLSPKQTLAFSLGLHELATNASKYGALSGDVGQVTITWAMQNEVEGRRMVELVWEESGGPVVERPAETGFGMRLIERSLSRDLGGDVDLDFNAEGVRAVLRSPVEPARSRALIGLGREARA